MLSNKSSIYRVQFWLSLAIACSLGMLSFGNLAMGQKKRSYPPLPKVAPTAKTDGKRIGAGNRSGDTNCKIAIKPKSPNVNRKVKAKDESAIQNQEPAIKYEFLVALVPQFSATEVGGGTSLARPNFWFYLNAKGLDCQATFEILRENGASFTPPVSVDLPNFGRGLVKVATPENFALNLNTTYRWKLTLQDSKGLLGFVQGYIHREAPGSGNYDLWFDDLDAQIQQSSKQQTSQPGWQTFLMETWPNFREDLSPSQVKQLQEDAAFLGKQKVLEE